MEHDVRWHEARTSGRRALALHAGDLLGVPPEAVTSGRVCPRCGSSVHGRPWLRVDGEPHHVSLSRSGDHLVTVLADRQVGIDVESVAAVAHGWDPSIVLASGESAGTDEARARAWVRKEAVLKQRGTGLADPMVEVVLAGEQWADLDAPEGYVAAISWAGREGRSPAATPRTGRTATSP